MCSSSDDDHIVDCSRYSYLYNSQCHGNVTSAGWQVTLCDPIWHTSSRSGVATLRTAIHLLLTYLLYATVGCPSVRLSVCLSRRSTAAAVCGRFAAERPAGAPNRLSIDIWCGRQRPAAHAVRVMLRAEKRGSKQTCFVCFVC